MADGSATSASCIDAPESLEKHEIALSLGQDERSIRRRAKREDWPYTTTTGRGGQKRHYAFNDLPAEVQAAWLLSQQRKAPAPKAPAAKGSKPAPSSQVIDSAWDVYARKTPGQQAEAKRRHAALLTFERLVQGGTPIEDAYQLVVAELKKAGDDKASKTTLWRWRKAVEGAPRDAWLPLLVPRHSGRTVLAECHPQLWDFYKGHYLTRAKPSFNQTYRETEKIAKANGWALPAAKTLRERLKNETSEVSRKILREGPDAARSLLPRMQRDAMAFAIGEAVNGDGLKFDRLWVRFEDGEVINTATGWFWQDIHSRKILAWRLGKTESTDLFRLATYDLTATCAPSLYYVDNTRVAANKLMTAGAKGRHRYKADPEDGMGLLQMIGGDPCFTSVDKDTRNPGAKPIERAFGVGGIHEMVATHPRVIAIGAYSKATAIDVAVLREVIAEVVADSNARKKRRTQACNGILSFDDAWQAGMEQRPPRVLSETQRSLLLMAREVVTARKDNGMVSITAGRKGVIRNTYWSEPLVELAGRKVVAHYDPDNLDAGVHLYGLDGRYLCFAEHRASEAFNSTEAGREWHKFTKRIAKANKAIAENESRMTALERAELYDSAKPDSTPDPAAADPSGNVVTGHFARLPNPERDAMRATGTDGATPDSDADAARQRDLGRFLEAAQRRMEEESF